MEEILHICQRHGVPFGTTASGIEAAQGWVAKGARFFEIIDELQLIMDSASRHVRQYRAAIGALAKGAS